MGDRICPFPSCGKPLHAHGYCAGHARQFRAGEPLRHLRPRGLSLAERFFAKVHKTETCWLWTGATNHLGYGQVWLSDERRVDMAHRVSVILSGREIPEGYDVDHLCRVPSCVNPDHLEPVTHAENMKRAPFTAVEFQAAKTHCPHGHEYTPENTILKTNSSGGTSRQCRVCTRESQARYRQRRRASK